MAWKEQWKVPNSRGTGAYVVSQKYDDTFACSCPSWTLNRRRADCKHILQIKLMLIQNTMNIGEKEKKPKEGALLLAENKRKFNI